MRIWLYRSEVRLTNVDGSFGPPTGASVEVKLADRDRRQAVDWVDPLRPSAEGNANLHPRTWTPSRYGRGSFFGTGHRAWALAGRA